MSKKQGIPAFSTDPTSMYRALMAVKNNIEQLTGVRGGQLEKLKPNATNAEIVSKINEIITRLNASGQ